MKKILKFSLLCLIIACCGLGFSSCNDDEDSPVEDGINITQQQILRNYTAAVVVPTYRSLADASIALAEDCAEISEKVVSGTLVQDDVDNACKNWVAARQYWERSEAFLFGAAADYNIDPHIDSWPLDLTQLAEVLAAGNIENRIDAGTAGYGLLGFHAVEYIIFKEGSTGDASNRYKTASDITAPQAVFAAAVAADMRDQCVRLEASWAGLENLTSEKQIILEDGELEPTENYSNRLINAGLAGNSKYTTQAAAFEEIIIGASDIANEVANTKIADPLNSGNWSDVESPHSWNSVQDFIDNIVSVRNAYYGSLDGVVQTSSVSTHIASINATIDGVVKDKIENAMEAINAMPRPFRNYISSTTSATDKALITAAQDACNELVDALDNAQEILY